MALALDEPKETDGQVEAGGVTYLIDKDLSKQIGEVKVDFLEEGWRAGFMVSSANPLSTEPSVCGGSCSC